MKAFKIAASIAVAVVMSVPLSACIPSTDVTCNLSTSTRQQIISCINSGTSALLTGSTTWSVANGSILDNEIALKIPAGKKVVLAENAHLTIQYDNIKHGYLPAVLVHSAEFYMSAGSELRYTKASGLPAEYDQDEENRHGILIEVGGKVEIWSATVVAGGYAAFAGGGGGNSLFANDAVLWGGEGVASVPDAKLSGTTNGSTTAINTVQIQSSQVIGLWAGLVIEPNSAGKLTKAVVQDSNLVDTDPVGSLRWVGHIGGYPTPYAALAPGSDISGNHTNIPASNLNVLNVSNCGADGQYIGVNDFPTSPSPC